MKVLFTFYNPSGGMETLNRSRCKILSDYGIQSFVLYTHRGAGSQNMGGIPFAVTGDRAEIQALLEREAFDLIVVCTDIEMLEGIRTMGYTGPLVYELQGLGPEEEAVKIIDDFEGRIRRHADALVYPETGVLRSLLTSRFPDLPHYCFDDPVFSSGFGYTSYPVKPFPVLAWVGRLERNKNWLEFLHIGQRLLPLYPNLHLWIFHDASMAWPEEQYRFEQYVQQTGLLSRVILHSNIPHYQMADYFSMVGDSNGMLVSTSIHEGFGYAAAEAMLCRCPVLATDSDGICRLVLHRETGILYPRGNVYEAVVGAHELMSDGGLRSRITDQALRHITTHFAPGLYAERFMAMVHSVSSAR